MSKPELTLEALKQFVDSTSDLRDLPTLRAYPGDLKLETLAELLMQENKKKVQQQLETGPTHKGITHWTFCITMPNNDSIVNMNKACKLLLAACKELLETGAHK